VILLSLAGSAGAAAARSARLAPARNLQESVRLDRGAAVAHFVMREPAGSVKLLRLIVPRGDRARLAGVIPGVAGVSVSTTPQPPIPTCDPGGSLMICSVRVEPCPLPAATWHFRLQQLAGPGGMVRVQFRVG
jgi:hypothetical protein